VAIRIGLLVAVVAAAIAVNVALLSLATASHEPVGRLTPVVATARPSQGTAVQPTPPALPSRAEHDADD
jgi:hypothetical protein